MAAARRDGAFLFCEARAPGRVNLIGEHTDYNDGLVLPLAIDRYCRVEATRREDRVLRVRSRERGEEIEVSLDAASPQRSWSDYPIGVAVLLEASGIRLSGADLTIASDVPPGGGLSSSAALEVAVAQALLGLVGIERDPIAIARICQRAENEFVGARCGIMDQMASLSARAGHALLLDCRSLAIRHVALPEAVRVVVVDSGVRHALASGEYNRRREECERAAAVLAGKRAGLHSLRDVTPADLAEVRRVLPEVLARRCRHVVTENARVEATARALESGRLDQVGELLSESHTSLARDYEVSCAELDALVRLARDAPGCVGARMTGGGFGGCTVNLVRVERVASFCEAVAAGYASESGSRPAIHVCLPSDGAAVAAAETEATRI
jgi:galactokinase